MISRQIDTCRRNNPVPISFLIHTASTFDCDIYIRCDDKRVNVKSYDEMICGMAAQKSLWSFSSTERTSWQPKKKLKGFFRTNVYRT